MRAFEIFLWLILDQITGLVGQTVDCAKSDFTSLSKECCENPHGLVFSPQDKDLTAALKACKSTTRLLDWANSYKINILQQKDVKNYIGVTNKNTIEELCTNGIFMECLFDKTNLLLKDGSINITSIHPIINKTIGDATWKTSLKKILSPINQATRAFFPFSSIVMEKFRKVLCQGGEVNLLPLMFMQMLQSELIWMCPKQHMYTPKNNCDAKMRDFHYCDRIIFATNGKGVFFFKTT